MNTPSGGRKVFEVSPELKGLMIDAALRKALGLSWAQARDAVRTGKVSISGNIVTNVTKMAGLGEEVVLDATRPRPHVARMLSLERDSLLHVDSSVVVVDKPSGISTVPFGDEDPDVARGTLDALVRELLARRNDRYERDRGRAPLGVVHRIDKETSGLLVFTRTLEAKKHLSAQFRQHTTKRVYWALVHGRFPARTTYRTTLIEDRGDGLRGSAFSGRIGGQLAITHVEPIETVGNATLVACRLETGRTHQIRIHLSEAGHPLVGEKVYIRNFKSPRIEAARCMLHARELGFVHPASEELVHFQRDPPADFQKLLTMLRKKQPTI